MKTQFFLSGVLITLLCCLSKHADAQENECVQNGGHCIFMAAAVACYHQLQLSCGSNSYFCCKPNIRSLEEADKIARALEKTECAKLKTGVCLSVYSEIYCPKKLDSSCGDKSLYCCQLS
ncbi:hypothetical protein BgiBS90_003042 [Biomphalaria glabrata]|nr:hypothetical protein BgiBS90_003042 [Biomphalaria glabrata]